EVITRASAGTKRWGADRKSPWFWKFQLLRAEALTVQGKAREADELLKQPVPGPELDQLELRRLVDRAALRSGSDASEILQRARASVADPELAIRVKLYEGVHGLRGPDAGQPALRAALAMAEKQANFYWQSFALNNLSR